MKFNYIQILKMYDYDLLLPNNITNLKVKTIEFKRGIKLYGQIQSQFKI